MREDLTAALRRTVDETDLIVVRKGSAVSDKQQHPITTMATPNRETMQRTLVALAWGLRESAGETERYLDSNEETVSFSTVTPPTQLRSMADACGRLADTLGEPGAALFFAASSSHIGGADAHLTSHVTYAALVDAHPNDQHLADLHDEERTYAARAMKLGRQLAHRGLSKLVEAWPDSFDKEDAP